MLAKQGWRLLQDKNSLLYGCFKAKYFPRCDFLEAKDCQNSFYVWKSLIAAQPILMKGCYWRVGNGASIRVLKDCWLPNQPTKKNSLSTRGGDLGVEGLGFNCLAESPMGQRTYHYHVSSI